jgi:hypothetical protein
MMFEQVAKMGSLLSCGRSDIGEVLTAGIPIVPGDFESFCTAFNTLANRIYATAQSIDACRYPISARDSYFRASIYFRATDFFLRGNPSDPRINSLWVQQTDAFDMALSLLEVPGKRSFARRRQLHNSDDLV